MNEASNKKNKRDQNFYLVNKTIETLQILEALDGTLAEPISIKRVVQRTKIPYDAARSILITLQHCGWATKTERGEWQIGAKLMRFSDKFNEVALLMHERH